MTSCLHLIQQAHEQLPWDALQLISAHDSIVVMNNSDQTFSTLKTLIPDAKKLFQLSTQTKESTSEKIDYTDLVKLIAQHKNSVSW